MLNRGAAFRYGGGELAVLPMENRLADAKIPGIRDEFFVLIEDEDHDGYFVPYLYVVLEDGYSVDDIIDDVQSFWNHICFQLKYWQSMKDLSSTLRQTALNCLKN